MHGCFIEKFFMVNLLETLHSFRCNLIISHVPSQIIFGLGPDQTQEHDLNPKSLSLMIPLNEASCNDVIEKTLRLCVCAFVIPQIQLTADGKRSHDPIPAFRLTFLPRREQVSSLYTFPAETLAFANVP